MKNYLLFFCVIFLMGCGSTRKVEDADFKLYEISAEMPADQEVERTLRPFRDAMNEQMDEVLIVSKKEMRMGRPESTMGNFVADATELMAEWYSDEEVAFAIQNYRGIRIGNIGKGDITLGRIYEMVPFDNYLVTVSLSGAEVHEICDFMAEHGGWPSSSSLTYEIKNGRAQNIKIDGKALDNAGTYVMASNDYVVQAANYVDFLKTKEVHNTNVYVRDAMAEYLRSLHEAGTVLNPALDQRVKNLDK